MAGQASRRRAVRGLRRQTFGERVIDTGLLKELRIEGAQRDDHDGGPPKWIWGLIAGLVVLALLGAGAWWFMAGNRPIAVQTATVRANGEGHSADAVLQATGYVTARRMATVSAQITGTLTEVLIDEGFKVRKGQVLARLDDTGLRAGLAAAEAQVRSAEANLGQLRAQLAQAQADSRRQTELAAGGMTTHQAQELAATAARNFGAVGPLMVLHCAGLEYQMILRGRMHYAHYVWTNPWDHAPGLFILEEAGGHAARLRIRCRERHPRSQARDRRRSPARPSTAYSRRYAPGSSWPRRYRCTRRSGCL